MFDKITRQIKTRMDYLERVDLVDRTDGTPRLKRLKQITPETGKFLALLASNCPMGSFVEIGTSAGYSAIWISFACMERGIRLKTFEILPEKIGLARETFEQTGLTNYVDLIEGDAIKLIGSLDRISFCFLDAEKDIYEECFDLVLPKLVKNGILVADNAIDHYETLKPFLEKALADSRADSLIVPIGKGELVCRKR